MKKDIFLKQVATELFYQQGWKLTSIAEICRVAGVSRVTFYKYFPTKQDLVKSIFEEQKNNMRQEFDRLLATKADLATVIQQILTMQQESMATLYSAAVLHDLNHDKDETLQDFFRQMVQEKYHYMHYFFSTLQKRKSIRNDFPVILIDVLIQKMDEMIHSSVLQKHYAGKEQQLFKDVLQLFLHGLTYQYAS
ncbi:MULTISPECIES: TetR/AcrR family transcriptional regulator [Haemophilus]|jgi:raw score 4.00|uniref:TetR/AcrR family transcriptional regulator n=2 Tax=Haemophilus TaxID=724 RepID=A0A502JL91_HAEHA|nr:MULTISPECIES: TetR/AcrR family transcriptional regulator [Haemophilus]KAA5523109.1 TetR/AcrR family transcriptional regulator [Haemophilus seminalis]MBS6046904.1 TetR/AcrR family transcriptional regulator [Haemophilus haemolyticus]MDK7280756.1 TetR/AcrR family transcriptional regulator [Haemophilus seminalis]TPG99813.1 TetR/AcrR family transcriptional regulator [Haemophilus haemolyticus]